MLRKPTLFKSTSRLTNLKVIAGDLCPELAGVTITDMEIEDISIGGGGFGSNHPCVSVNGTPPRLPLLIKILRDDGKGSLAHARKTVIALMQNLKQQDIKRQQQGLLPLAKVPALRAIPQFWFEGKWRGQSVCGYAAVRLDTLGFAPFSTFTDGDPKRARLYQSTPTAKRFRMIMGFAEGMQILSDAGFLHGDMNPENLFVHLANGEVAIIDFDSGGVGTAPWTWGKPTSDWIAPEIIAELAKGNQQPTVTPQTEAWSLGVGIHYLLFLFHPLVFLKNLGGSTLAQYFQKNQWPELPVVASLRHKDNCKRLTAYANALTFLPQSAHMAFDILLNQSVHDPQKRPTPALWQQAFQGRLVAPRIKYFTSDTPVVLSGGQVTLSWDVENAVQLELLGIGNVTGRTSITLTLQQGTTFTLIVHGLGGKTRRNLRVQVIRPPSFVKGLAFEIDQALFPTFEQFTFDSGNSGFGKNVLEDTGDFLGFALYTPDFAFPELPELPMLDFDMP
jgi:Protein kinase domain